MTTNKKKEALSMEFTGEWLRKLKRVMKERGIHNKTELVRVLIKEEYDKKYTFELPPSTIEMIDLEVEKDENMKSRSELIERAVKWYLYERGKT